MRSFGTEDRPTTNPVAGRNDVYEYIIFKANDIKDLIVCDTPKPVVELSGGLPYDPAIITVSQNRTSGIPSQPGVGGNLNTVSGGCKFPSIVCLPTVSSYSFVLGINQTIRYLYFIRC